MTRTAQEWREMAASSRSRTYRRSDGTPDADTLRAHRLGMAIGSMEGACGLRTARDRNAELADAREIAGTVMP